MALDKVKLDHSGIAEILKSAPVAAAVREMAEQVANGVRSQKPGAEVVVDSYGTDRAAASVTIRDVRGRVWEVRDGALTRAASGVGLEVTERA